jgi:Zn-dependent protease
MSYSSRLSTSELIDLLISFIILTVAFSMIRGGGLDLRPENFLIAGLGVGTGFLLHELAHKFVAMRYGYKAEYKAWYTGLILTLLMSFIGFIIALPGAVMISKPAYRDTMNPHTEGDDAYWDSLERKVGNEELWISLAGPVTNIVLAAFFFALLNSGLLTSALLGFAVSYAMYINLILAAFNLLPIGPMDGAKIFRGNALVWTVVAVPTILVALGFMFGVF